MAPKRDLKLEALLPYLDGKKTVVLAADSPSDLETVVNLANDFKLKFVLNHISHSQPVLDYVASLKVPVIVGPIYEAPKDDERYDAVYSLPAQLYKRGVKIAFASYSAHNVRNLARRGWIRHRLRSALRRSDEGSHYQRSRNLGRSRQARLARRRQDRKRSSSERRPAGYENRCKAGLHRRQSNPNDQPPDAPEG